MNFGNSNQNGMNMQQYGQTMMKSAAATMVAGCGPMMAPMMGGSGSVSQGSMHSGNVGMNPAGDIQLMPGLPYSTMRRPDGMLGASFPGNMVTNGLDASSNGSNGYSAGPMRGSRMSVPVHQTAVPYVVPNCPQKYMMDKRARANVGNIQPVSQVGPRDSQCQSMQQMFYQNAGAVQRHSNPNGGNIGTQAAASVLSNTAGPMPHQLANGVHVPVNSSMPLAGAMGSNSAPMSRLPNGVHNYPTSVSLPINQSSGQFPSSVSANCLSMSSAGPAVASRMSMYNGNMPMPPVSAGHVGSNMMNHAGLMPQEYRYRAQGQSCVPVAGAGNSAAGPVPHPQGAAVTDGNIPGNPNRMIIIPMQNGTIIPMLKLEHNMQTTNLSFQLRNDIFSNIINKRDVDIELRCFRQESMEMVPSWPEHVTICVNSIPLAIDRGTPSDSRHRPVLVKSACRPGLNSLQISVTACCCADISFVDVEYSRLRGIGRFHFGSSHLFIMRMVHYSSLTAIVRGLFQRRLLPVDYCAAKIMRFLPTLPNSSVVQSPDGSRSLMEAQLSVKCPITCRRMNIPARGHNCEHIQCFDLEAYIATCDDRSAWICPICRLQTPPSSLEIDHYMWGIVRELATTSIDQVIIDSTAAWRPQNPQMPVADVAAVSQKSVKMMNKSNTTLPTIQSWSGGQHPSKPIGMPSTTQSPLSPESVVLFSPLSVMSDHGVAPSPCHPPPGTPDCFVYSAPTPTANNIKSPAASSSVIDLVSPTSGSPSRSMSAAAAAAAQPLTSSASSLTAPCSDSKNITSSMSMEHKSVMDSGNNRTFVEKCPASSAANAGCIAKDSLLSQPASMSLTFDAVFSKEEEKIAMEDILSDAIPDLSDFLPSNNDSLNASANCPLPDDDFLSLFT